MKWVLIVALLVFGLLAFVGLSLGEPISISLGCGGIVFALKVGEFIS